MLARRIRLEAPKSPIAPVNRMRSTANPMPLGSLWGLRWDTGVGCETGMPLRQRREPLLPSPAASAVRWRIARASRSRTPACLQSPFRWKPGMRRRLVNRRLTVGRRLATVYSRRLSCHHSDFYSIIGDYIMNLTQKTVELVPTGPGASRIQFLAADGAERNVTGSSSGVGN